VGRRRQPEIRELLLAACTDYALEQGLPSRLEPFAAAAGTSTRMLIYHFDTRDALLREVLGQARWRQRSLFGEVLRVQPDEPYVVTLARAWSTMTGPAGRPFLALFGRLREDSEQRLWPGFKLEATTDWLAPLEEGLESIGRPELATLVLAVIRGLIMDLEATSDAERTDRAFTDFLQTLKAPGIAVATARTTG
jgi:AcrR family transcriptional regulator